ncbi:TetR/AcrR family transcriptional regulator [Nonomuraea pusilla]|uniref:TetR/AcrR family transcriptional regulator n=1 Tax=Nonomuraea pusilla TaxID=46177 RepID=UPI000B822A1C|nr:TetR family transcriptional regulator C-terminal domain-containing protein [Nonomuraea pusilla]
MPKVVDPAERRREVVDALFRVVIRDGLERASLRTVAAEARLNVGSVRHYFATHEELKRFAMRSMIDRVGSRLHARAEAVGDAGTLTREERKEVAASLFAELLPLDEARRAEVTVFLDFITAARTDPSLQDLAREAATGARALARRVLTWLELPAGVDVELECERLTALLDGLGMNAVLYPELIGGESCLEILRTHLDTLIPPPPT